jgi:two-component system response regulator AtoC
MLAAAPWEGNVRELRNVVERACLLSDGDFVTERELALSLPAEGPILRTPAVSAIPRAAADHGAWQTDSLARVERDHIQRALTRAGGNKKIAAQMLGLSRRALYRRLERLDLADTITRRREGEFLAIG